MKERVDYFGKYSLKMNEVHNPVLNTIINKMKLDSKVAKFNLVQCNFSEYIERHPKEPKYYYELYHFNFKEDHNNIMFAFNKHFFKSREETYPMIDLIVKNWITNFKLTIKKESEGKDIYDLNLSKNDMIQTAHYLYPTKNLLDNKIDYQLFKIIYPYNSLKPVLDLWDKR